jgi:hypothetical protein
MVRARTTRSHVPPTLSASRDIELIFPPIDLARQFQSELIGHLASQTAHGGGFKSGVVHTYDAVRWHAKSE